MSSLPFSPTVKCVFHLEVRSNMQAEEKREFSTFPHLEVTTSHVRDGEKREFPTFPHLEVTTSHVRDGEKREFPTCSPTVEMCLSFRSHRSCAWCRET